MKIRWLRQLCLWTILFVYLAFPFAVFAFDIPKPVGFVNDFAGLLTQQEVAALEAKLSSYQKKTSNDVTIAIFSDTGGEDAFSFGLKVFEEWGIGKSGKDNGVLIFLGPNAGQTFPAHGELFVHVGRGLEGALTDGLTGTINRGYMFPQFKVGKYYQGFEDGTTKIIEAIKGEFTAESSSSGNIVGKIPYDILLYLLIGIPIYITSFLARSKSWWMGGVLGGIGGLAGGFWLTTGLWIAVSAFGLAGFGLLFDFLVSRNYASRKARGLPTSFWHSGGGFWWGGRGGFGGGGGGFGGFGGGHSGGGGAGGSW